MATVVMTTVLLLGLMFATQAGLAYHARQVAIGAAQDGAATGARLGSSPAEGEATARALVAGAASNLLSDVVVSSDGSDTEVVTITVSATVLGLLPFVPAFEVSATSSSPVERFRPQEPWQP